MSSRLTALAIVALSSLGWASVTSALAHEGHETPPQGWGAAPPAPPMLGPPPEARLAWLNECRSRIVRRDDGLGGALIGGAIGGLAGNRIAGRHHRTVGTIAGAAVGAVAGAAIDRADDRGSRDECERYLDEYYAYYTAYARAPWNQAGYGCCMQPVAMPRPAPPECREEVRYVTEYVTVPGRRIIPPRPRLDKRIRIAPDKRVRTN